MWLLSSHISACASHSALRFFALYYFLFFFFPPFFLSALCVSVDVFTIIGAHFAMHSEYVAVLLSAESAARADLYLALLQPTDPADELGHPNQSASNRSDSAGPAPLQFAQLVLLENAAVDRPVLVCESERD